MTILGRSRAGLFAGAAALALFAAGAAQALPTGGVVVAEQISGTSITSGPTDVTVHQSGDRVVINWNTFDVASGESVNFNQPTNTAITFNRVLATGPTTINGNINAYGGVFIFAPGGMLFGSGAQVNVGALVASSVQLPSTAYNTVLTTDTVPLPPPSTLNPSNPFPSIAVDEGANISASYGFVALVGPNIRMDGTIDAFDNVAYVGAEGGNLSYTVIPGIGCDCGFGEGSILLDGASASWVIGRGRVSVSQGSEASVSGSGFVLVTPPPVLEPGFQSSINLAGTVEAQGYTYDGESSVILSAGPPVAPGWANATSGLLSPGSLGIQLDTSGSSMSGSGNVLATAGGTAALGEMDFGGSLSLQAYDDITFNGDSDFSGSAFITNGGNLFPIGTGVGDVAFNADFHTKDSLGLLTFGDVTLAPGISVLIGGDFEMNGVANSTTQGVRSVTLGDDATLGAGGLVQWNNLGGLDVGENANIHGDRIDVANRGAAGVILRQGAVVSGANGASFFGLGPMTIETGAYISSTWYSGPDPDTWPVNVYSRLYGGVQIVASDLHLDGNIYSTYGEGGIAPIVILPTSLSTQMILGGADAADAPGVFRLSNSEVHHIVGNVVIGPSSYVTGSPIPFEVRDLDFTGGGIEKLSLINFADGDITISGNIRVEEGNDFELRVGLWSVVEGFQQPDTWRSLIPRDILITGSIGSPDQPLDSVRMAAQRDILIGTPSYVAAAQLNPNFDPQFPQEVAAPAVGQLFIDTAQWSMLANGRVFQQNSALTGGHSGFAVNEPQNNDELFIYRNFADELDDFEISFDFGANPPVFPNYAAGPTAISLHGVMFQDGPVITGYAVAEHPNNLADEFDTGPSYFINDCQIFGCETESQGGTIIAASPFTAQYAAIVARRPGETLVNQAADRVIIDWSDFQVNSDEQIVFHQLGASSITFNRQQGGEVDIGGLVKGDNGVFLFSPHGIYVSEGAEIDVGALVLSSVQLPHSEFNAALTSNVVNLLSPTELDEDDPFPAVDIESGAQLTTDRGFVALVGPNISMDGDIDASDSILNLVGEGGTLFFNTNANGFTNLSAGVGYVFGRTEIAFSQNGTATSGGGYSLITPPPVLAEGLNFVMHVGGQINAGGSVFLYTGGAQRPGFNGGVLQNAGSGYIALDTTDATIVAGPGGIGGGANYAAFGPMTTSGAFSFSAVRDIDFYGDISVGSASFTNGQGLPYSQTGDGDVSFHADVHATGDVSFGTLGEVTFDPNIILHAGGQFVFGLPSAGTSDVTFGNNVHLSTGSRVSWNGNNGDLHIGDNVVIDAGSTVGFQAQSVAIARNSLIHAGDRIVFTSFGDTQVGQNSDIIGENGVAASNAGRFALASGATVQSHNSPEDTYPLAVYGIQLGGVFIQAADVDLQGDIISTRPLGQAPVGPNAVSNESEPGLIILDITQAANSAIVGGADAPNAAGVFRLSASEYARLHGLVTVSSAPLEDETPVSIEVRGLTLDAHQNPSLTVVTFGAADVSITGTIVSANATGPSDTQFRVGEFLILDNSSGLDQWENLIPRDILITGAIGTEDHPVGVVGLIAQRDILMGTPAYIAAVQGSSTFDPLHPPTVDEPSLDQVFIAANIFQFAANGRVFQQNSAAGLLGSGILIGVPTEETPLTVGLDFQQLYDDYDGEFSFGSNPPHFPSFSSGPLGISLWGTLIGDGFTVEGSDAAQNDFLLSSNLTIRPQSYYINGCEFGGACANGEVLQATVFHDPTLPPDGGFEVLDQWAGEAAANNPLSGPTDLLADFIVVPAYDPGADAAGIGQSVTGSGNGDLWVTPQEAQ